MGRVPYAGYVQGLETAKQLKKSAVLDDIGDLLLNSRAEPRAVPVSFVRRD
jgi:hypothetical protein